MSGSVANLDRGSISRLRPPRRSAATRPARVAGVAELHRHRATGRHQQQRRQRLRRPVPGAAGVTERPGSARRGRRGREQNNTIFNITGAPVDVIVFALGGQTDGTGGADHGGCDFSTGNAIEVDAAYGAPTRVRRRCSKPSSANAR